MYSIENRIKQPKICFYNLETEFGRAQPQIVCSIENIILKPKISEQETQSRKYFASVAIVPKNSMQ